MTIKESIAGFVALFAAYAYAEKISKHIVDDFEEWYWTKTVTVQHGSAHTFWITGLTENTAITDIEVYSEYTYTEDGEKYDDYASASETVEVENSSGGFDKYVLLTADDWEWVPSSKKSLSFTVKVSGWGGEEYSNQDLSFTFGHADGESEYPGEQEPAYVAPKGSSSNPQTVTITDVSSPATAAKMTQCEFDEDTEGVYFINISTQLQAGHKYFFGIDNCSELGLFLGSGSDNLLSDARAYEDWVNCTEAYEFIPDTTGSYRLTVNGSAGDVFNLYTAALPARKITDHTFAQLAVDGDPLSFVPGYMNDPESGAFDDIIDQQLFIITGLEKNKNYIFRTEGATMPLEMRLYDSNGKTLAKNLYVDDGSNDVLIGWTSPAAVNASTKYYIGVCQQLEYGDEPSVAEVTITAKAVTTAITQTAVTPIPDGEVRPPDKADGAIFTEERALSDTEWVNTYVLATRAGVTYRVKAVCAAHKGLTLGANIYTLSGTSKRALPAAANVGGAIDAATNGWLEFTPVAHGNVYIDVYVASGEYGYGADPLKSCSGLTYGPYTLCASAAGDSLGILTAPMKGAPQSLMGWKILSGPGIVASKEVFYAAGTSAILSAGEYTLVANKVANFSAPDAKGYAKVLVEAGPTPSVAEEYKYVDIADPLDDEPDTKAKHPSLNKAYAPAKLAPTAAKSAMLARTLWAEDNADWYTLAATAGSYYRLTFTEKSGDAKMAVYGPDNWTSECEYTIFNNPESILQFAAKTKGNYYVKVSHLDDAMPEDGSYTLEATTANPGVIKFAKTDIAAKDNAAYVDLSVSRSAKDGLVRVKYRTEGCQTDASDAYYYPTNGVLRWEANDLKAQTIRVRLVPNGAWASNKVVKVVLEAFRPDNETFDADKEYSATFATDPRTGATLDTATITISASARKAPGTIQLSGSATPKKPVITVTAGDVASIKLERILGVDGIVGIKAETVKGTANKSSETDFTPATETFIWDDGDSSVKEFSIATKKIASDYASSKTFTIKLTALTSKKGDAVQYDKPTLAATSITVNIINDKFACTMADYAKTVTAATDGYTIREAKAGAWVVNGEGSFYAPSKGDLTFTFTTTGTFRYTVDGVDGEFVATSANKTLTIKNAQTFTVNGYDMNGETVALYQGVKYDASFGDEGTVKVANLPTGLKLAQDRVTKEWIVSGVPSKAGVFQTIYTKTIGKTSSTETYCYKVAPEGTAAGTFTGLATTFDTTNSAPSLASVSITAAVGGKLSAKVMIGGKVYTFADTGYSYHTKNPDDADTPAYLAAELTQIQKVGSGKDAITVTNRLYYTVMDTLETDQNGWLAGGEVEIQMDALPDAKGNGYQEDVWYFGTFYRDNSKSGKEGKEAWEAAMSSFAGYYTLSLVAPDATPGVPRGSGYMTMTLDGKGKAKLAGMLADGTTYSGTATAALSGEADEPTIRVPLYAQKGTSVFGGWLALRKDANSGLPVATIDALDADIVWRNDDPATTRDGYEGFSLYLQPVGGWYDTVANLQRHYLESNLSAYLPDGEDALDEIMTALGLVGDYSFAAQPSGEAVEIVGDTMNAQKQGLVKDATKKFNDWENCVNASNLKLTFKRATGIVNGTFDLWYDGINTKGVREQKSIAGLKHYGVLIWCCEDNGFLDENVVTSGFFLAPQTISEEVATTIGGRTTKKTVTRKWNGSYRSEIKAATSPQIWTDADVEDP